MSAPIEHQILFSGEMVRAILEGRKTQTRRVIKPEWWRCLDPDDPEDIKKAIPQCPYGKPGDTLWVKETFCGHWGPGENNPEKILTSGEMIKQNDGTFHPTSPKNPLNLYYKATYGNKPPLFHLKWKSSRYMPRWASRITLKVVNVRVDRVQKISADDIYAEGCQPIPSNKYLNIFEWYADLWDSINTKRGYGWDVNPYVWVIEFEVMKPEEQK